MKYSINSSAQENIDNLIADAGLNMIDAETVISSLEELTREERDEIMSELDDAVDRVNALTEFLHDSEREILDLINEADGSDISESVTEKLIDIVDEFSNA